MESWWLNLLEKSGLDEEPERVEIRPGEVLFREGEVGDAMYVVVEGTLEAIHRNDDGTTAVLGTMGPGDSVGEVQLLSGGKRTATVSARSASELVKISAAMLEQLTAHSPEVRDQLVEVTRRRLNRSLLASVTPELFGPLSPDDLETLESFADWVYLQRGEELFRQGSPGTDFYVVLSGRLGAFVRDEKDGERLLGTVGRGQSVGEAALISREPRSATVRAVRNSLLLSFSKEGFQELTARFPQVPLNIARLLMRRLASKGTVRKNLANEARTIAVIATEADASIRGFAAHLTRALSDFGRVLHLSQARLMHLFGSSQLRRELDPTVSHTRLLTWLDEQEQSYDFLVFETDASPSAWTRRCLAQADHVLLVARAGPPPSRGTWSELFAGTPDDSASRTSLVLVHPADGGTPRSTGDWLTRLGLRRHHHLRAGDAGDVERLGRSLTGRAVGLTLGGGGARAFAEIGVIRALQEAGVPIDAIGGSSMGSLIAAQFALCGDPRTMVEMCRRTVTVGRPDRDLTLPVFGLIAGRRAEKFLGELFADHGFEDLRIPCFAVSANLTTASQVVHTRGSVRRAIRASVAVPGAFTPAVHGSDLLIDGGVLDNLPGDVMRRFCGGRVVLVDVSPDRDLEWTGGPSLPSPWKVLLRRLNPFVPNPRVPTLLEILIRSSTLTSIRGSAEAKAAADLYFEPPVERFGMFDVTALDDLVEIGYRHACEKLASTDVAWLTEGLPSGDPQEGEDDAAVVDQA